MRHLMYVLVLSSLAVSCALPGARHPEAAPVASTEAPQPASPQFPEQQLTNNMMYDILLGEIAGQRGEFDVAVPRYIEAAERAQDPRVAQRAVQVASFARQYDLALIAARRWVALDGQDLEARKTLVALALQAGDLQEVVTQMDYLLGVMDDQEEGFRTATAVLARHPDKQAALTATQQLVDRYPANPYAWMALCRIAVLADQLDTSLQAVDKALELKPGLPNAIILKAQVLVRMERNGEATRLLQSASEAAPKNTDLAFAYGRMLLDGDDLDGARSQFTRVVKLDPDYPGGLYSLALLELETHQYKEGEKHLKQFLDKNQDDQNAYYYLGYATYEQGNKDVALGWYQKVESGDYWSQAMLRAAEILVEQGKRDKMQEYLREMRQKNPEHATELFLVEGQVLGNQGLHQEAYDLYARALESDPVNEDLLYSYALAAEEINRLDVAEATLRQMLAKDPENVRTLNALGYTLADRTDRYQEALTYISKAHMKSPEDPAIIDSLGWVYFRLGDLARARSYLQQAWDKTRDAEIGAHYGEVLWASGEQDAARAIWGESRKSAPDNAVLQEVLQRIKP